MRLSWINERYRDLRQQSDGAIIPRSGEVELMQTPLVLSLVVFALGAALPFVSAQDSCDRQFVVSHVSLPMTRLSRSEQAAIRARLIGRCFDDQQLSELAGPVRDTLQSLGYLHATVSQPTLMIADASRHPQPVSLNVEVAEGARYKVTAVEWWNLSAVSFEQITSVSPIQVGDVLDMSKIRETLEAVRRLYAANGYPQASIVPQFREAGHGVTVSFAVVEGPQLH
jgi:outer membrane protein assembly factor BamA